MLPRILLIVLFAMSLGVSLGEYPNKEKSNIGFLVASIIFINFILWLGGWYDNFLSLGLFK